MDERLKNAFSKVISKHYSAVQTDEALGHTEEYKPELERTAKQFWTNYVAAKKEFEALLERCKLKGD